MALYVSDQISKAPSKLTDVFYYPVEYRLTKETSPTQKGEREKRDNHIQVTKGKTSSHQWDSFFPKKEYL